MSFKKVLALTLCVIMLLSFASCGGSDDDTPAGYTKISEDGVGYTFYMDKNWKAGEQSGMTSAIVSDFDTSNMSVMGFDPVNATSAEEYWDIYSAELTSAFKDIEFTEDGVDTTLGGEPAKKYVFTADISGHSYKLMQIICYRANTTALASQPEVYVFTYTAKADKYDEHYEAVRLMADYMKFDK